ncbi:CMRF35-like molecule 5 [Collichthys lucidus]|uniref:CMRF35-like molecule 5 n=1 Tax=Collichthys lucidus TaxID=240159 RepID=A0A4U5UPB6_COLLU|nr:CMRF35-like molecule 5 [Collichthys lucidus]
MKILCLILFFHASLQLQCDKRKITAHVGGEFRLICKYDTRHFLFSKKYWCRGEARNTCEILVDSEDGTRTAYAQRAEITDARRYGLFVKVRDLQFEDSGVYWVGIDKIYADIMASVNVVITEVSKPKLRPLSSQVDRPTCWGQPVTVRCGCEQGTGVRYAWYKSTQLEDTLLNNSADIHLQCGTLDKDSDYYCTAHNDISSDRIGTKVTLNCAYKVKQQ